jgi:hypothetical protein
VPSTSESRSLRRTALESFEKAMHLLQDCCESSNSRRWGFSSSLSSEAWRFVVRYKVTYVPEDSAATLI